MAQRSSASHRGDERAQSDNLVDIDNPQLLTSEMAKAFEEVAQAEKTASALEAKLDGIHKHLDQLLASFEELAQSHPRNPASNPSELK
ncbi:uncharacterized protein Z519_04693 [Cladophialophora bantiana CBS 173.52]|uniref:Uncharacterized protein n=1 Tax=Cladophialophora bantiana (strain ATCC 10958 / CBS 173.52 / CDC B-1940 / NIH 8579) TaxID=1442370 RepID=A0A0D2EXM1_CLAB1|nr:uncharacterized protein Z519_04693 [Cladophialophora bantiana CBS 173.52]KIW94716.1 hypothetical protein Z519_04693 [Cladophialophora bantiana CBS 173.52]